MFTVPGSTTCSQWLVLIGAVLRLWSHSAEHLVPAASESIQQLEPIQQNGSGPYDVLCRVSHMARVGR